MRAYTPPHPGEFLLELYLLPAGLSCRELAVNLGVAASTLNRVLKGSSAISPEMALRLAKALGRSPESWLHLQTTYDLWHASKNVDLRNVSKVRLKAA
jgi:antitoxin HigA-1